MKRQERIENRWRPLRRWRWRRKRPLPLRLWLILAVAAIIGAGFLAQMGLTAAFIVWDQQAEDARLASVREAIGTDAMRWRDPVWQRQAMNAFAPLDVQVALFDGHTGSMVYATPGAGGFLRTSAPTTPSPVTQVPPDVSQAAAGTAVADSPLPEFERIVIPDPTHAATGRTAAGVAFLWFTGPPPGEPSGALWPGVELGTFALTLAVVVWLVGWPVLRPLADMSGAVESMAGGDLEVHLPPSPVREIAEVSEALAGMSAALRKSLARQAALEEERRLFIGAVAHDLRTPLFMLRGYLKGLERGVAATPEKMARYVAMCQENAEALERLITDLFAYTRLEYLESEPDRAPLEIGALLRQAVEDARPLAAAKGVTLAIDAPPEPCMLVADIHLLARAIANLLDNALRYTPEGGVIRVRWHREDAAVVFAVEDTGPGIATEDLPHLFTPLYRGEASRNRQTGGAGLGLTISQRIVRAHGGDLTAANVPGGGAIFTGTLPAPRQRTQPPAGLTAPASV